MLNKIVLQGRMTRDAELRQTDTGVSVTAFTMAVDRDRKEQDGSRKTDFIDCVAWRNTAEYVCKYGGKGCMTIVEGKLRFRDWTDKSGNNRRSTEILVDNVYFCDRRKQSANEEPTGFQDIEDYGDLPY